MSKLKVQLWATDENPASPEAQTVLARFGAALTPDEIAWVTAFVDSQVAIGNWDLIDEFQFYGPFSDPSNQNRLTGWKLANATLIGIPLAGTKGFEFNGVDNGINTGFRGIDASMADQASYYCGAYVYADNDAGLDPLKGIAGANSSALRLFAPLDDPVTNPYRAFPTGESVFSNIPAPTPPLALGANQNGQTSEFRQDGVSVDVSVSPGALGSIGNTNFFVGAINGGGFFEGTVTAFWLARHENFDYIAFHTALDTLLTNFGVLP